MSAAAQREELQPEIEAIEAEHEQLVALFDEFDACIRSEDWEERLHGVVSRAITCANAHFAHEEELMAQSNYPRAEEHKFRHRILRLQFTTFVGDAMSMHATDPVTLDDLDTMRRLLTEHLDGPDQELVTYLSEAGFA